MSKREAKLHPYLKAKFDNSLVIPKKMIREQIVLFNTSTNRQLKKVGIAKKGQPVVVAEGFISAELLSKHLGMEISYH